MGRQCSLHQCRPGESQPDGAPTTQAPSWRWCRPVSLEFHTRNFFKRVPVSTVPLHMLHVHAHVHGVVLLFPRTVGGRGVARELLAYFPGTLLASVCMLTFLNKNRLFYRSVTRWTTSAITSGQRQRRQRCIISVYVGHDERSGSEPDIRPT